MEKTNWFREHGMILLTGVVIGIAALVLTAHGNPTGHRGGHRPPQRREGAVRPA